jgi:hypothetical protein
MTKIGKAPLVEPIYILYAAKDVEVGGTLPAFNISRRTFGTSNFHFGSRLQNQVSWDYGPRVVRGPMIVGLPFHFDCVGNISSWHAAFIQYSDVA